MSSSVLIKGSLSPPLPGILQRAQVRGQRPRAVGPQPCHWRPVRLVERAPAPADLESGVGSRLWAAPAWGGISPASAGVRCPWQAGPETQRGRQPPLPSAYPAAAAPTASTWPPLRKRSASTPPSPASLPQRVSNGVHPHPPPSHHCTGGVGCGAAAAANAAALPLPLAPPCDALPSRGPVLERFHGPSTMSCNALPGAVEEVTSMLDPTHAAGAP